MKSLKITQSITDRQDESLGYYFKDVHRRPLVTADEEKRLIKDIKEGNQKALNRLIEANLRFVISVAKQYQGKGLPLVDLIQEGNIGLISAAKKWDPDRGIKFISYAVWWVRQAIIKALSDQCRTVRLPISQIVCAGKAAKFSENFEQKNERLPSLEETAEAISYKEDRISLATAASGKSISLESPFKEEDVSCLLDVLPNDNSAPTDSSTDKSDLIKATNYILSKLPNRESDILRMSFGIGMRAMNREEIGEYFGVGGERIRQLRANALKFLHTHYKEELIQLL